MLGNGKYKNSNDMKEFEIKVLEDVTNGVLTKNDILRKLLFLYGVKERCFYHYAYTSQNNNGNIITNELIECSEETYDKIKYNNEERQHKPIKYMSNEIPSDKKLKSILYVR